MIINDRKYSCFAFQKIDLSFWCLSIIQNEKYSRFSFQFLVFFIRRKKIGKAMNKKKCDLRASQKLLPLDVANGEELSGSTSQGRRNVDCK